MTIKLKTEAGIKVVQFEGQYFNGFHPNDTLPAHTFKLGEFNEAGTVVNYGDENPEIVMTKAQYDDIKEFKGESTSRVAGEPYTAPKTLAERFGILTDLVTNLLGRVTALENPVIDMFPKFALKNGVIRGTAGERDKTICKYDLKNGNYRFCQTPFNPDDVEDSRYIMTIVTEGLGNLVFLTANSGEIGRIEDALTNGTDIVSIEHTATV